jgi:hypothetical protein
VLFRLGPADAGRLCITEAAINAMSLAAIEAHQPDSLELSTGDGWSPATVAAIRALSARAGARLVAATDNNWQEEVHADRLEVVAQEVGCDYERLPQRIGTNSYIPAAR